MSATTLGAAARPALWPASRSSANGNGCNTCLRRSAAKMIGTRTLGRTVTSTIERLVGQHAFRPSTRGDAFCAATASAVLVPGADAVSRRRHALPRIDVLIPTRADHPDPQRRALTSVVLLGRASRPC